MEAKTSEWRPGPTVCRCCLTEGCYKDISTEYFWMGKREVYAEMLADTLNLTIAYSQSGGPNSNSRLICEPCISRLRDAADFKRQVQECEKTFLQHLDPSTSGIVAEDVSRESVLKGKQVKIELVKLEKDSDDDDFEPSRFTDDDDVDDDNDQPLTKLAKTPKKETVDLLDLIDNAKVAEKRKSTTKVKATPVKKAKQKKDTKATANQDKPEKKKKGSPATGRSVVSRKKIFVYSIPQRNNAELILKYSSAYPFKTRYNQVLCAYCHKEFEILSELNIHKDKHHLNVDYKNILYGLRGNLIKVDISNLECKLCRRIFHNINDLMVHFSQEHNLPVHFNASFGVLPYKYVNDHWVCVNCGKTYTTFIEIKRHIPTHFMNYNCEKCGTTFISYQALNDHQRQVKCNRIAYNPRNGRVLRPRSNAEIILQCSSAYPFRTWMSNLNCIFCSVKTRDPVFFRKHMAAEHETYDVQTAFYKKLRKAFLNVDITNLKCKLCLINIDKLEELIDHLKKDHNQPIKSDAQSGLLPFKLNDGSSWNCAICNNQFKNFDILRKHTQSHFNNYVCDTCGEGFITESALVAHNKIPHENKYSCSRCVATFSNLIDRSIHVKTQHTSKPYVCLYCDDKPRFSSWEMKKKHQLVVHNYGSNENNYECTLCGKSFKSRSGKYNHMARVHRHFHSELSFICTTCSRSFTSQLFLDKHMAKKHTISEKSL